MKIYRLIFIFVLCLLPLFSWGQNERCATCGAASSHFSLFVQWVQDVSYSVQSFGTQDAALGRYTNPGLLQSEILDYGDDDRSILGQSLDASRRAVSQTLQGVSAISRLFLTDLTDLAWQDGLLGLRIFAHNQAIVRDWRRLLDLDDLMQDKVMELSLAASWTNSLSTSDRLAIQTVMNRYVEQGLFTSVSLDTTASYRDVFVTLKSAVSAMKSFIINDNVNRLSTVSRGGVTVYFNTTAIVAMQADYICARGVSACQGNLQNFVQDVSSIGDTFAQGASDASQTIREAVDRLQNTLTSSVKSSERLSPEEQEALQEQEQLLRIVYGSDTQRIVDGGFLGLHRIGANVEQGIAALRNFFATVDGDNVNKRRQLNQQIVQDTYRSMDIVTLDPLLTYGTGDAESMAVFLGNVMLDTQSSKNRMQQMYVLAEHSDVSVYFPLIRHQIKEILAVLGNKNSANTLVHNLGLACENQCQNVGGTCWY